MRWIYELSYGQRTNGSRKGGGGYYCSFQNVTVLLTEKTSHQFSRNLFYRSGDMTRKLLQFHLVVIRYRQQTWFSKLRRAQQPPCLHAVIAGLLSSARMLAGVIRSCSPMHDCWDVPVTVLCADAWLICLPDVP